MKCPGCKKEIPEKSKFCPFCRKKTIDITLCKQCNERVEPDWEFCINCGQSLDGEKKEKPVKEQSPPVAPKTRAKKLNPPVPVPPEGKKNRTILDKVSYYDLFWGINYQSGSPYIKANQPGTLLYIFDIDNEIRIIDVRNRGVRYRQAEKKSKQYPGCFFAQDSKFLTTKDGNYFYWEFDHNANQAIQVADKMKGPSIVHKIEYNRKLNHIAHIGHERISGGRTNEHVYIRALDDQGVHFIKDLVEVPSAFDICYSPDNKYLAVSNEDGVHLLDCHSDYGIIKTFRGPISESRISFSNDLQFVSEGANIWLMDHPLHPIGDLSPDFEDTYGSIVFSDQIVFLLRETCHIFLDVGKPIPRKLMEFNLPLSNEWHRPTEFLLDHQWFAAACNKKLIGFFNLDKLKKMACSSIIDQIDFDEAAKSFKIIFKNGKTKTLLP